MGVVRFFGLVLAAAGVSPALAGPAWTPAENDAPLTIVQFSRTAAATEIRIQTREAMKEACWSMTGPNSPYLLAAERRYRLIGGEGIAACPKSRDYSEGGTMVLRFEPLKAGVKEFSLIEGVGGESALLDPDSATRRYWNFLHIKVE
jgi:hypothetical protein